MADPRQLEPDHHPTPFTADEIRQAIPSGLTLVTLTGSAGGEPERLRHVFTGCDADGATLQITPIDAVGAPVGPLSEQRLAWGDLQALGSFPVAGTTRREERILTPLGKLDCTRYDVTDGADTTVYWFCADHPGLPIRRATRRGDRFSSVTTVISIDQPAVTELGLPTRRRRSWFGRG